MHGLDADSISALIDHVYAAALQDEEWPHFLVAFTRVVGHCRVMLHGHDTRTNRNLGFVDAAYEGAHLDSFRRHYSRINPWLARVATMPVGTVQISEAILPRDTLLTTEFYNDWIRPQEDIGTGAGVTIFRDANRMFRISANIRIRDQEALQDGLVRVLTILTPHLARAFEIMRLRAGVPSGPMESALLAAIDRPAIVVDALGRFCAANAAGEALLERGQVLRLGHGGQIVGADGGPVTAIAARLDELAAGRRDADIGIVLRDAEQRPVAGALFPVIGGDRGLGILSMHGLPGLPAAILVLEGERAAPRGPALSQLHQLKLTPAETRLLTGLMAGQTLREIAAGSDLSVHTLRNQLKSIFRKVGVKRQTELLSVMGRLSTF